MEPITNDQMMQAMQTVSERTNSELIRFFVLLAVVMLAMIAAAMVLYPKITKQTAAQRSADAKADTVKLDRYIQREGLIIDVVTKNTEAITKLTATLDTNTRHCDACKADQVARLDIIGSKIDQNTLLMARIAAITEREGATSWTPLFTSESSQH